MINERPLQLRISIHVSQIDAAYQGIELAEQLQVPAKGFMEMCKILAQFQELVEKIRKENLK